MYHHELNNKLCNIRGPATRRVLMNSCSYTFLSQLGIRILEPFCKKSLTHQISSNLFWWQIVPQIISVGKWSEAYILKYQHILNSNCCKLLWARRTFLLGDFYQLQDIFRADFLSLIFLLGNDFIGYFCWEGKTNVQEKSCWLVHKNKLFRAPIV